MGHIRQSGHHHDAIYYKVQKPVISQVMTKKACSKSATKTSTSAALPSHF